MKQIPFRIPACVLAIALAALTIACGGGGGSMSITTTPTTPTGSGNVTTAPITLNVSDSPLNGVLTFNVTFSSATLTGTAGTVNLLTQPTTIEFIHLAGHPEPLMLTNIPQGTYSSLSVTISALSGTILTAGGQVLAFNPSVPIAPVTITFPQPVTLNATHTSLNLELLVGQSLSIDGQGNVTFNPTFALTAVPTPPTGNQDDHSGKILIAGPVTATTANSLTIGIHDGRFSLTFVVDGNTKFDGVTGLSQIQTGQIVLVYAVTQSSGTLLAQKIEVHTVDVRQGLELEGFVLATTGNPVTSFVLAIQRLSAPGIIVPVTGARITITPGPNAQYKIGSDMDLTGLPFTPKFDATTLGPAQAVEVSTDLAATISISGREIELNEQALVGTISNYSVTNGVGTFTLTTTADSPFALVAGTRAINVVQRVSTATQSGVAPANAAVVRVAGLLFFTPGATGAPGTYNLVAKGVLRP